MKLAPPGGEALERAPFPTLLDRTVQGICSIGLRHKHCSRAVCRRTSVCTPPRHKWETTLFRCRFDDEQKWRNRALMVGLLSERLRKICEEAHATRGLPSPFAEPAVDHLDLTRPFDIGEQLKAWTEEE
jgi:hypothetical protein